MLLAVCFDEHFVLVDVISEASDRQRFKTIAQRIHASLMKTYGGVRR